MPRKRPTPANSSTRKTASAPSTPPAPSLDTLANKAAETQQLVAAVPSNPNKPSEIGHDNAVQPIQGFAVDATSRLPGSSTITEVNVTDKTGASVGDGVNATIDTLDRVRVDNTGRMLTTNQGVPVGDNQNSLKAGLRGPTLLEDFILREKITHFDHERIPERIVHARGSGAHGFFECY